jgi:hypothetical protein
MMMRWFWIWRRPSINSRRAGGLSPELLPLHELDGGRGGGAETAFPPKVVKWESGGC